MYLAYTVRIMLDIIHQLTCELFKTGVLGILLCTDVNLVNGVCNTLVGCEVTYRLSSNTFRQYMWNAVVACGTFLWQGWV